MNIHIAWQCLADRIHPTNTLLTSIRQNAELAWKSRDPKKAKIRFMQKMSDKQYRFLNVTQQNGSLWVSRM